MRTPSKLSALAIKHIQCMYNNDLCASSMYDDKCHQLCKSIQFKYYSFYLTNSSSMQAYGVFNLARKQALCARFTWSLNILFAMTAVLQLKANWLGFENIKYQNYTIEGHGQAGTARMWVCTLCTIYM